MKRFWIVFLPHLNRIREYVKTERTAFVPEMKGPWVYLKTLKRNEREKLKYSSKLFIHPCFQNTWISFRKWKIHEQRPMNWDFVQRTYKWSRLSEQHCLNKGYFMFSPFVCFKIDEECLRTQLCCGIIQKNVLLLSPQHPPPPPSAMAADEKSRGEHVVLCSWL